WRKPRIQHIRVNNAPAPLQGFKFIADRREERAAMKAGGWFPKRKGQLPIDFTFDSIEQFRQAVQSLSQPCARSLQHFVGDRAGLNAEADRFQADLQVRVQYLPPADGLD